MIDMAYYIVLILLKIELLNIKITYRYYIIFINNNAKY